LYAQERVLYNKEIQTANFDDSDEDRPARDTGGVGTSTEDARREHDAERERARNAELEAESVQLDREIMQELHGSCHANCLLYLPER
jgi:hypothetical protein